jgi:exodeoxyribonuclease VII large subunit
LQRGQGEIKQLHAQARSLSPQLTLERGYSVVTDENGKPLSKIAKSKKFMIRTSKQEITATADEVRDIK